MLEREAGSKSEAAFLRLFPAGKLVPVDLTIDDYERMAELVELYADWPLAGTDASLIASAEPSRDDGRDARPSSLQSHPASPHAGIHFAP